MLSDLRQAVRSLRKAPGFTLIAVLCLAIGIGANTTVFSAVNTLLVRPLPFHEPEQVVLLRTVVEQTGDEQNFSHREYRDWGDVGGSMSATGVYFQRTVNLGGVNEPERVETARVSASLLPLLGFRTTLGRHIRPDEEDDADVAIISEALWRRRFAADPQIVGRAVTVNGAPVTVIGVLQPGIRFPETADLWMPLAIGAARESRGERFMNVVGRLRPDVSVAEADAKARAIARRLASLHPETNAGRAGVVLPFREDVAREVRPIMLVMLGAVGFVLLIACANVANLLLARATTRQRDVAVRVALGASRARIVRQLLAESVVLAALGGAFGALLGSWGMDAIARSLPLDDMPFWMTFEVDRSVLALTAVVSLGAAVVFGLAPALQASTPDLTSALKESGARGASAGARSGRARSSLVVAQLALSLVLLVGASLMMRSFVRLQTADPGFSSGGVLTFETSLQGTRYEADSTIVAAYAEIERRLAALPGVQSVGSTSMLPLGSCCSSSSVFPEGRTYQPGEVPSALRSSVTGGFFDALRVPLRAGRVFDDRDRAGAPATAVISEETARRLWPGEPAVGRRFRFGGDDSTWVTVVGVVADVKQDELTDRLRPQLYLAVPQGPWRTLTLTVRTAGDGAALAPAVRRELRAFDADLPVSRLFTLDDVVRRRMFQPRVYSTMFFVFAASALLLATVGLYGVMAHAVAQRTHEIGVRVALGANARDVMRLVMRQGARLVIVGLVIGVPAAFALASVLRGALHGVSTRDPLTFIGIPLLLASVALLASYVPARRAMRVDPAEALRSE